MPLTILPQVTLSKRLTGSTIVIALFVHGNRQLVPLRLTPDHLWPWQDSSTSFSLSVNVKRSSATSVPPRAADLLP